MYIFSCFSRNTTLRILIHPKSLNWDSLKIVSMWLDWWPHLTWGMCFAICLCSCSCLHLYSTHYDDDDDAVCGDGSHLTGKSSFRCKTCGEYIYKGKKFNARKETVQNELYLGLPIFRFYIKCTRCLAEITFKVTCSRFWASYCVCYYCSVCCSGS